MNQWLRNTALVLLLSVWMPSRPVKLAGFEAIEQALGTIVLDPTDGSFSLATVSGKASYARYLYYLINSPAAGYAIRGSETGFVGLINLLTGNEGIGSVIRSAGYNTCDEIPISGSADYTGTDGLFYTMTFLPPSSRTVPAHFPTGSTEAFDKRITLTRSEANLLNMELKCQAETGLITGYLRMNTYEQDGTDGRQLESYFQFNSTTKAS